MRCLHSPPFPPTSSHGMRLVHLKRRRVDEIINGERRTDCIPHPHPVFVRAIVHPPVRRASRLFKFIVFLILGSESLETYFWISGSQAAKLVSATPPLSHALAAGGVGFGVGLGLGMALGLG